jgi:hypothetical protein
MRHEPFQGFATGTVLLAASIVVAGDQAPAALSLDRLTVPTARLAKGCRLSPLDSESERAERLRRNMWPMGIATNPWRGTDRRTLATIRAWIGPPAAPAGKSEPDGPPMSARERHSFQMQLADSVEEGYAALYSAGDSGFVTVMGIRLTDPPLPMPPSRPRANEPWRFASGRTIVTVEGEGSPCFAGVVAYVGALFTP